MYKPIMCCSCFSKVFCSKVHVVSLVEVTSSCNTIIVQHANLPVTSSMSFSVAVAEIVLHIYKYMFTAVSICTTFDHLLFINFNKSFHSKP